VVAVGAVVVVDGPWAPTAAGEEPELDAPLGAGGTAVTCGAGSAADSGTAGNWLTCAGRTMWNCCWASAAMRAGVSSWATDSISWRCRVCSVLREAWAPDSRS